VSGQRPTEPAAVAVEGLTVARRGRTVVEDVAFEVGHGEVVGLVGKRHAGTSTVLRALLGLLPSTGRVRLLGRPYRGLPNPGADVGVFLGPTGNPDLRVRDDVRIAAALRGADADDAARVITDAGLADRADVRRRRLPTSARQRLGIATVRLTRPRLVVLDDPATGLDPDGVTWLRELLRELADARCGVLVACHPLSAVAADLDRAVVLDRGRVVVDAPPAEIVERAGTQVVARTPDAAALRDRLEDAGAEATRVDGEEVRAADLSAAVVTRVAAEQRIPLLEAREDAPTLDEAVEAAADGELDPVGGGAAGEAAATSDDDPPVPVDEDAEQELDRETASAASGGSRTVVFASPARGAGTTTLAALAADALAVAAGRPVVAVGLSVDRDHLVRPVPPRGRSRLAVVDLVRDAADFDDLALVDPYVSAAPSGLHVLRGAADEQALAGLDGDDVRTLLELLGRTYDRIVVDAGAELSADAAEAVADAADAVVLVGTPDAGDALAAPSPVVEALERAHPDGAVLVVNRTTPEQAVAFARRRSPDRAVVPEDAAIDAGLGRGDAALDDVDDVTRVAIKHLASVVAGATAGVGR
jgi:ABC-2 type transport system ATP-binding protein